MQDIIGVNIPLKLLIRECSLKKKTDEEIFRDLSLLNRENIHEIFKYKKFNYDFSDYVTIYNNEDDIVGNIRPCYYEFLCNLLLFLNLPAKDIQTTEELTKALKEKVSELKKIKTETELKNKFPFLFNDLIIGREYIDNSKGDKEKAYYYYSCALKKGLDNFIETQVELYTRFIERREEYDKLIATKDYNDYFKENFDMDKVAMLTADCALDVCRNTDNFLTISKFIGPIQKYIKSKEYKKYYTLRNQKNEEVREYDLELGTINLVCRYNEMKQLDADWEILPPGQYKRVKKNKKSKQTLFNIEELNRLRDLGDEKESFYKKTNPLLIIRGRNRYKDYLLYVYKNGEVILDREYIEDNPNTATGAAIFNFRIGDFETLSKLNPSVLKDNPKATRIEHRADWKDKVLKIINREETQKDEEEIKMFLTKKRK